MSWKDPHHSTNDSLTGVEESKETTAIETPPVNHADLIAEHHQAVLRQADLDLQEIGQKVSQARERIKNATAIYEERQRGRA